MTTKQILKSHKIEQVKCWINKLTAHDDYCRDLLRPYNGDELDKMALKEIEMLLKYMRAAYHMAYQTSRKNGASNLDEKVQVRGSQRRIKLEDSSYKLIRMRGRTAIIDAGGHYEEWVMNDHFAGYTLEIDGIGFEFVTSYYENVS